MLVLWFLMFVGFVQAKRSLFATSLVTCIENSQLSSNSFNVTFNPDDRSLYYNLDMTTSIDSYIYALVDVYAYGFKIITKEVDLCNIGWKQFCPVHPGNIQIESIEYISKEYTDEIPGIAYHVPDIDAFAKVRVFSADTNAYLACVQVFFSNGKTVSQTAVKWVSAVIAGIGLLLSAVLSSFGNSRAASHISANTMLLFLYFQSVVVVAMEHVHRMPPIASAWAENLVWSMGLIRVTFMQKIFRWFVQSTGGTPELFLTSKTQSVLAQRTFNVLSPSLVKRATEILYGNQNTKIFRGIKRLGYLMRIESTSIVPTGFTFFVLCGYLLAAIIIGTKYAVELCIRAGWMNPRRFLLYRKNWRPILKGALLRYIYIGFVQLTILSFWEFTERDSGAVIVIACLFVCLSCGLMLWAAFRTLHFGKKSVRLYNNPAALLYGDEYVLHKYGFFYTMFNAKYYWWNIVLLCYMFLKALFVGFAQGSGKTQALALFIFDFFYTIAVIRYKPFLDRPTNIMNIFICVVTCVNSFLFMFFSDLFHQGYQVSAIMGWVFFIMNAAFSLILLLMILTFVLLIVFSKNPDLKFKPIKDDRASFQKTTIPNPFEESKNADLLASPSTFSSDSPLNEKKGKRKFTAADELLALGQVAGDHDNGWENAAESPKNYDSDNALFSPFVEVEQFNNDSVLNDHSSSSVNDTSVHEKQSDNKRKVSLPGKIIRAFSLKGYKDNYDDETPNSTQRKVVNDIRPGSSHDDSSEQDGFYHGGNDFEREPVNPFESDAENEYSTPNPNQERFDSDLDTESFSFSFNRGVDRRFRDESN
ncbi:transient receptor potential ion channel family protein [Nakaseomyces bracarensis]|uniref:transient receptor potential ion channel family protein n=1 Tax=Nakaseomyces bracarensis TaxID=273131 RepID=UPI003871BEE0